MAFQAHPFSPQQRFGTTQAGQAGLIIMLLAVVVLTIGLSLFVRTSRQADLAIQQEESARIFNAAETGVEKALADILSAENNLLTIEQIASQQMTVENNTAAVDMAVAQETQLETYLNQGDIAEIVLANTNTITFQWSKATCLQNPAALVFSIQNTNSGTGAQTTRYEAIKGPGCASGNNFTEGIAGSDPYKFSYQYTPQAGDVAIRIEPIFSGTDISVSGQSISKAQFTVVSKAQDSSGGSDQAKAIEVKRTLSTPPSFMDYSVYSGSTIVK